MFEIYYDNKTNEDMTIWEDLYNNLMVTALKMMDLEKQNITLSISWINKKEALDMNQKYRKEKYVPDVISFPIEIDNSLAKQMNERELGDIFICYEVAMQKAEHYKHDIYTEMAFLFVHGLLHLLGYDHDISKEEEKKMFDLQDKILKAEGINYEVVYDDQDYL